MTIFSVIVAYARSQGNRIELTNSVVPLLSVVVSGLFVTRYHSCRLIFTKGGPHSGVQVSTACLAYLSWKIERDLH